MGGDLLHGVHGEIFNCLKGKAAAIAGDGAGGIVDGEDVAADVFVQRVGAADDEVEIHFFGLLAHEAIQLKFAQLGEGYLNDEAGVFLLLVGLVAAALFAVALSEEAELLHHAINGDGEKQGLPVAGPGFGILGGDGGEFGFGFFHEVGLTLRFEEFDGVFAEPAFEIAAAQGGDEDHERGADVFRRGGGGVWRGGQGGEAGGIGWLGLAEENGEDLLEG